MIPVLRIIGLAGVILFSGMEGWENGDFGLSPIAPAPRIDCPDNTLDLLFDDFGGGPDNPRPFDPGFSPEYVYRFDSLLGPGDYTVAHRSEGWAPTGESWINTGDQNGDPESYIALFNGSPGGGVFWQRSIGICPGTEVEFSVDVLNLIDPSSSPAAMPNIDLLIDGQVVAALGDIAQDGQWQSYVFSVTTNPDSVFSTISLRNNTVDSLGNDFAIDNLVLRACAPTLSAAELNPEPHCVGDTIQLEATLGDGFTNPVFRWQVSTNEGQNFIDFGEPTDQSVFTVEDLPPNAQFRVLAAPAVDNLFNGGCVVFSDPVILNYRPINECSNVITSVGDLCAGELGENIVPDGDFGSGAANVLTEDPMFAPGYTYQPDPPPNDGFYTITNNTAPWGDFAVDWLDFGDNSDDPNGYMMVVNATFDQTDLFFERTVEVCENTTYEFSVDLINVQPEGNNFILPNVAFMINGQTLFNSGDVPEGGIWQTYGFTFTTAPGVTELQLSLRNNAPGGLGNDFAMDNISFRPCGPALALSEVNPQVHCPGDAVELSLDIGPGFTDPVIQWQVSSDDGESWEDVGAVTSNATLSVASVPSDVRYRALVAESLANLTAPACRITSNEFTFDYRPIGECIDSPVDVVGDLCQGALGMNLAEGGDFGSGDTAFGGPLGAEVTSLEYAGVDTFPGPGQYVLTQSLREDPCQGLFQDTCWIPIARDTSDTTGYAMIIDASAEPDIFFQAEVSDLCENTIYQFSAEVVNLHAPFFYPNNPDGTDTVGLPNLDLIVAPPGTDRELLKAAPAAFNSGDIPNDTIRRTIGFTFEMKPGESDLMIAIRNNGPGGFGNDLALDNVVVAVCGPPSVVTYEPDCEGEPITLDAEINGSQFPDPAIQWIESRDGGQTWAEVPGATQRSLFLADPAGGALYSFLIAADAQKLQNPNCRINAQPNAIGFLPSALTLIDTTLCEGETITAGGQTFGQAGNFEVMLQTFQGCDSLIRLNLTIEPPAVTNLEETICEGTSFMVGDSTFAEAGSYTVTIARPGLCDSLVNLSLSVLPVAETDLSAIICPGESVMVGENTYTEPGSYVDTLLATSGCDSIVRLNLSVQEEVVTEQVIALCPGEDFMGLTPAADTVLVDTLAATSGCDSISIISLRVSELNDFAIAGDTAICPGVSTTLSAGEFASYRWSTGATGSSIQVTTAGLYQVTVTDILGCTAEAAAEVTVQDLTATVTSFPPLCPGEETGRIEITDVTGTNGPFSYSVNGAEFQDEPVFGGLESGNYQVEVRDLRGCTFEESLTLKEPDPLDLSISPEDPPVLRLGDSLQLNASVSQPLDSVRWAPSAGLSCIDCLAPLAFPSRTTTFDLTVIDGRGCQATASIRLEVDDSRPVFVPNAFSPNGDGVNDRFVIYGNQTIRQIDRLLVFDRWGGQVFETGPIAPNDESAGWDGTRNGQESAVGVYVFFAELTFQDGQTEILKGEVLLIR